MKNKKKKLKSGKNISELGDKFNSSNYDVIEVCEKQDGNNGPDFATLVTTAKPHLVNSVKT